MKPTALTVIKAIAAAEGQLKGSTAYLTKYQMIHICKRWLELRTEDMSKLAHSNQETMYQIETSRIADDGEIFTLQDLLRQTVKINGADAHPDFRVAYQGERDGGSHFIIHINGHDSETLDFIAKGDQIQRLQNSQS